MNGVVIDGKRRSVPTMAPDVGQGPSRGDADLRVIADKCETALNEFSAMLDRLECAIDRLEKGGAND